MSQFYRDFDPSEIYYSPEGYANYGRDIRNNPSQYSESLQDPNSGTLYQGYENYFGGFSPSYHRRRQDMGLSLFGANLPGRTSFTGETMTGEYDSGLDRFGYSKTGQFQTPWQIGPDMQQAAEREVKLYNERMGYRAQDELARQAETYGRYGQHMVDTQQQGLANLQTYRPGGASAMLSGFYGNMQQAQGAAMQGIGQAFGNRANTWMNMRQYDTPDHMFDFRQHQAYKARKSAQDSSWMNFAGGLGQAGLTAAGMALGGPPGAMAGAAAGQQLGGQFSSIGQGTPQGWSGGGYYAEGGHIPAQQGGKQITVSEGGEGEHVVPDSKVDEFVQAGGQVPANQLQDQDQGQPAGPRPEQVGQDQEQGAEMAGTDMFPATRAAARSMARMTGMPESDAYEKVDTATSSPEMMDAFLDNLDAHIAMVLRP